jgi:hypothetical protein
MDEVIPKGETEVVIDPYSWVRRHNIGSTDVAGTEMFLIRNFHNFYMDISGKVLYIKFDTCPPLYWY